MAQINPYLRFDGNCREAMTFYKECFGGELTMMPVEGSPMADQMPPEERKGILHADLTSGSLTLLGSDLGGPEGLIRGNAITLTLICSSAEEQNTLFTKLSSGGQITHPLEDFFAGKMGDCTDKFGINWALYYDNTGSSR